MRVRKLGNVLYEGPGQLAKTRAVQTATLSDEWRGLCCDIAGELARWSDVICNWSTPVQMHDGESNEEGQMASDVVCGMVEWKDAKMFEEVSPWRQCKTAAVAKETHQGGGFQRSRQLAFEACSVDLADVHGSCSLSTVSTPRKSSDCDERASITSQICDGEGCGGDLKGSLGPPASFHPCQFCRDQTCFRSESSALGTCALTWEVCGVATV